MDALVPLKRLDQAKTRLGGSLDASTRVRVMRALLDHTLGQVKDAPSVGRVILVSSESESIEIAQTHGIEHFDDRRLPWNDALAAAIAERVSSEAVLILSADLPLVSVDDVEALIAAMPQRGVAIARARDVGTNALAIRPAAGMPTCFGAPQSSARHAELAAAAGLDSVIVDIDGLAVDLDSPEDLENVLRGVVPAALRAALSPV